MTTLLTATITTPSGTPIDAMLVVFARPDGSTISTSTDACGGLTIETAGPLALSISQSIAVDATVYEAGTILRFEVPEDRGDLLLSACLVAMDDASPAALLAQITALAARIAVLEGV